MDCSIWKKIIINGHETNYSVSQYGDVRNDKCGNRLAGSLSNNKNRPKQYRRHGLSIFGQTKLCATHRLVAIAFIPNPDNLPYVNHIDGDTLNNHMSNLEWVTPQENTIHAWKTGLATSTREVPVDCYNLKGVKIATYKSLQEASRQTGAPSAKICVCCSGQRTTSGGYQWRYSNDNIDSLPEVYEIPTAGKPVAQIDTETGDIIAIYASFREGARAVNGTASAISRVCSGKKQTKTHKGYGWKLVHEIVQ